MTPWWLRLLRLATPYWRALATIAGLMVVAAALHALKPWPLKLLVDRVAGREAPRSLGVWVAALPGGDNPAGFAAWLAVATVLLFASGWCVQTLHAYIQSGVANRISYGLGAQVFERLQRLSLKFHHHRPTGDLVRRVTTDSRCVRDLVIDVCLPAQAAIVTLAAMAVVMLRLDWMLALVALLVAPALLIAQRKYYGPIQQRLRDQQDREGAMTAEAEQTLTAIPMVQAFRAEAYQAARYRTAAKQTLAAYFASLREQLQLRFAVGGAAALGRAAVMLVGGYRALEGHVTPGDLVVFLAYVGMLYEPIETLASITVSAAGAHANAQRVFEVLDSEHSLVTDAVVPAVASSSCTPRGNVEFRDVTFSYVAGTPVLRGMTFAASPGEVLAIVGPTGSGKSTLVSLLLRFFDPCEGQVLVDGVDVRAIRLSELRGSISILLQDALLLPTTIAENIAYGRPDATLEEIVEAARAAHADEFIARLPQGYDTVVGERGATLSGGEQQRIAIARAFLKAAPILVLDEPTSALDAHSEAAIVDALMRLASGRTCIVIAHRASMIRRADRVLELSSGSVARERRPQEAAHRQRKQVIEYKQGAAVVSD
jgi:ATP-binding cassette subfamily B protein